MGSLLLICMITVFLLYRAAGMVIPSRIGWIRSTLILSFLLFQFHHFLFLFLSRHIKQTDRQLTDDGFFFLFLFFPPLLLFPCHHAMSLYSLPGALDAINFLIFQSFLLYIHYMKETVRGIYLFMIRCMNRN